MAVTAPISGSTPDTTYYYEGVATNAGGTTTGRGRELRHCYTERPIVLTERAHRGHGDLRHTQRQRQPRRE